MAPASATSTPVPSGGAQVVARAGPGRHALGGMQRRRRRARSSETVLLNQRVEHESAVDATQYRPARGILRPRLGNHQAFAFLTGHLPTSCWNLSLSVRGRI